MISENLVEKVQQKQRKTSPKKIENDPTTSSEIPAFFSITAGTINLEAQTSAVRSDLKFVHEGKIISLGKIHKIWQTVESFSKKVRWINLVWNQV